MDSPTESASQHLNEDEQLQFVAETRRLLNEHLLEGQITEETQSLLEVVLPVNDLEHVPEAVMQAHLLCRTQAAVALLLPPLADAELYGEAVEEYFVQDAGELRDQAAAVQLEEQACALKAQAGAAQPSDVPAAVAKLQQAWPLPEALAALRHALQEPPAEPLDGADAAKEQQAPAEHLQAAGPATQEPPAQHLQAAGPAAQEQRQMPAEHLQSTGSAAQERQEPPAEHLQDAGAAAERQQQAPVQHLQGAGAAAPEQHQTQLDQQTPLEHLQGAGPSTEEQQVPLKHSSGVEAAAQDQQEPPAESLQGAGAAANSQQQVQLGKPPTDAPLAHQPSGGDEQLGHQQQQSPEQQSAPQQAVCGEQQGHEQQTPQDEGQAAAGAPVPLPPASGHAGGGRPAQDEGEPGSGGTQAAADAQEAAEPSPAEQPLPGTKVQAGAFPEAKSGREHQGRGQQTRQAAKQKNSETVEQDDPGQLSAESPTHQLQQTLARAALQAGCSSQQQAGAGAGSPLLKSEGSPFTAVSRLLQSQVQALAGGAAAAEHSVDDTQAGAAGPPAAGGSAAEETEPAMTIPDSEDQAAAGQGRAAPGVPQEAVAGVPAVPSPTDKFLRPAAPAFLPAVFGGSLAGKQAGAQARSVPGSPVASQAESIDASTQPESIQDASQDVYMGSLQQLPEDTHLDQAAAEALAAAQAPDEAAAVELSALQAQSQLSEQQVSQAELPVRVRKLLPQQPQLPADESLTAATESAERLSTGGSPPAEETGGSLAAEGAEMHQHAAGSEASDEQREKELPQGHGALVDTEEEAEPPAAPPAEEGSGEEQPNLAQKEANPEGRDSICEDSLAAATLASTKGQAAETEAQQGPVLTPLRPGAAEAEEVMSPLRPAGEPDFGDGAEPFGLPPAAEAACPDWQQQPSPMDRQEAAAASGGSPAADSRGQQAPASPQAAQSRQQRSAAAADSGVASGGAAAKSSGQRAAAGSGVAEGRPAARSRGQQASASPQAAQARQQCSAAAAVSGGAGGSPAAKSSGQQAVASPQAAQSRQQRSTAAAESAASQAADAAPEPKASSPPMGDGAGGQPEVAGASLQARSVSTAAAGHAEQSLPQEETAAAAAEEGPPLEQAPAEDAEQGASAAADAQQSLLLGQAAAEGAEQSARGEAGSAAAPDAEQSPLCGQAVAEDTEQETQAAEDAQQTLLQGQAAAALAEHSPSQEETAAEDAEHIAPGRPESAAVPDVEQGLLLGQTAAEDAQQGAQARPGSDAAPNAERGLLLGQTAAEDAEQGGKSRPSGLSPGSELNARRHQRDIKVRRRLAEQKAQQQQAEPARPLHAMAAAAAQQRLGLLPARGARPASRAALSAPPFLQALAARHGQPEVAQRQAGGLARSLAPQQAAVGGQGHSPSLPLEAPSRAASPVEPAPGAGASRPPSSKPSAGLGGAEQAAHVSSGGPGSPTGRPLALGEAAESSHTGAASSLRGSQGGSVAGSRSSLQMPRQSSPAAEGKTGPLAERPEGAAAAAVASASAAHRAAKAAGHSVVEQQHKDQHVDICHAAAQAASGRQLEETRPAPKEAGALPSSNVRSKPPSGSSRSRSVQPAKAAAGPPAKAAAEPGPGAQRSKESGSLSAGPPAGAEAVTVAAGPGDRPADTERHTRRTVAPQAESCQRVTGRKRSRSQSAMDSEEQADSAQIAAAVAVAASALQSGSLQQQQQQRPERVPASSPAAPAAVPEAGAGLAEGQPARQGGRGAGAGKRLAADISSSGDSPEAEAAAKRQRVGGGLLMGVMYQCIRQAGVSRQATPQPSTGTASGLQQPAPSARVTGGRPTTRAQAAAAAAAARGQASGANVGPLSDHSMAVRPASAQPQPAAARPAQPQLRPVTAGGGRRLASVTAALRPGTGSTRATSHDDSEGGPQRASSAAPTQALIPQQLLVLQMHSRQAAEAQAAAGARSAEQEAAAQAAAAPSTAQPAARTTAPPPALHARPPVRTGDRAVPAGAAPSPPRGRHEAAAAQHSQQAPRPAVAPVQPRQQPPQVRAPPAQPGNARRSTAAAGTGGAQGWQQYGPAAGQGRLPSRAAPARGTSFDPPEGMKAHWDSLMHPEQARLAATVAPPGTMTMEQAVQAVVQDPTRKIPLVVPAAFREANLRARRAAAAAAAALTSPLPGTPDSSAAAAAQEPEPMEADGQEAGWAAVVPQAPRHSSPPVRPASAAEASRRVAPQPPMQRLQPEREPPAPRLHRQDAWDSAEGWQQRCMRPAGAAKAAWLPLRAADSRLQDGAQMGAGQDDSTAQPGHDGHTEPSSWERRQGVDGHMLFTQQPQEESQWAQEPALQAPQPQQADRAEMRAAQASAPCGASAGTGWAPPQQPAALPGGSPPAGSYGRQQERYNRAPGAAARWPGEAPSAQHHGDAPPRRSEAAWTQDSQPQFHADRAAWQPPPQQSWRQQPAPTAAQQQRWHAEQPQRHVLPPRQAAGPPSGGWMDQGYADPAQQPGMAQRWAAPPMEDRRQLPDARQAAAAQAQAPPPSSGWQSLPHMQQQGWQGQHGAPPAAAGSGWQGAGPAADPPQQQRWQQQPGIPQAAAGSRWQAACPAQSEGYPVPQDTWDQLQQQGRHGATPPSQAMEWANPGLAAGYGHMQPQQPSWGQSMLRSGHADASRAPQLQQQQGGAMQAAATARGDRHQAWQQAEAPAPPLAAVRQQAARFGQMQGRDLEGDTGSEASLAGWQPARRAQGAGAGSRQAGAEGSGPFSSLLRHLTGRGPGGHPGSHPGSQAPGSGQQQQAVAARSAAPSAGPSRLGAPQASWHSEDALLCRAADQASLDMNAEQNGQQNQHHQGHLSPLNASLNAAAQEADPRQAAPAWPGSRLPAEASLQRTRSPGPALTGWHGDAEVGHAEALHTGNRRGAGQGALPAAEDEGAFDVGAAAAGGGQASSSARRQALQRIKQTSEALRVLAEANQQIDAHEEQIWGPSRDCQQENGQRSSVRPQKRGAALFQGL